MGAPSRAPADDASPIAPSAAEEPAVETPPAPSRAGDGPVSASSATAASVTAESVTGTLAGASAIRTPALDVSADPPVDPSVPPISRELPLAASPAAPLPGPEPLVEPHPNPTIPIPICNKHVRNLMYPPFGAAGMHPTARAVKPPAITGWGRSFLRLDDNDDKLHGSPTITRSRDLVARLVNPRPQLLHEPLDRRPSQLGALRLLDCTHESRADDHAVGARRRYPRLVAGVDAETHDHG
jgi:hypothetical protein